MTRLACERACEAGVDVLPLLRRVGLAVPDLEDESVRLSVAALARGIDLIAQALNDPLLGFHLSRDMDLRLTGALYYLAASSETLAEALQGFARYAAVFSEGVRVEVELGDELRVAYSYAGLPRQSERHHVEAWCAGIVRYSRNITGLELQPTRVRMMHPRIQQSGDLDAFFGRAVEFAADADEVCFSPDAAKLPIVRADRYLRGLAIAHCEAVMPRGTVSPGALRADVESIIAALLPRGPTRVETVAHKLGLTPRTLRRKLAAEGATFAGILQELRFALAKRYLAEQDASISEIAWRLGYTEVSAFSHAFRRWSGRAPRADRGKRRHSAPRSGRKRRHTQRAVY